MTTYPLHFRDGHLFVEVDGGLWLFDTGAPSSFGGVTSLSIDEETFHVASSYMGMTAGVLSRYVGVECAGLLGGDILNSLDFTFDPTAETIAASHELLPLHGSPIELDEFMGVPVVPATIAGSAYRMFFDTGAQVSYFQHDMSSFPPAGTLTDFYPGMGRFETETHVVDVELGGATHVLRCGTLPGIIGMTLQHAGTDGIVGNELMRGRCTGYSPRRGLLAL